MAPTSVVKIPDPRYSEPISFYLDKGLKRNFDEKLIPSLKKRDKDCVLAIDGKEGSGKSTLAFQIGKYVDPTLDISRVVFDAEGFRKAIFGAKKGQCVIYDEAFTGFSSRASLSAVNKVLVSLMMQMRQKNLLVIIVLPTFFLLDKYVALFRTKALIHVYENKGIRGYFRLYNAKKKKFLYLSGKPTLSYGSASKGYFVRTNFKGRFYGVFALGDKHEEEKYRKKKSEALEATEKNPMRASQVKYREQRNLMFYIMRKVTNLTYTQMANYLLDYNLEVSESQLQSICSKYGAKGAPNDKRNQKPRHPPAQS